MLREASEGFTETVGNRVKPDYHFIRVGFCSFLFLSARFFVTCQPMLKSMSAHIGLCEHEPDSGFKNIFKFV